MLITTMNLAELAGRINTAHADCMTAFEASQEQAHRSLDLAREAGKWLNQAKAEVPHGGWLDWVKANCGGIAERTAQAYMQIHREWDQLQSYSGFSQLNYSTALALLGKLNQPEPVEVIQGELVEPKTPIEKPAKFEVGQQAIVKGSKPEVVEIVRTFGNVLIGANAKGVERPYLPLELLPATPESQPQPKLPKTSAKEQLDQAVKLLQQCLECNLPLELRKEINQLIS